MHTYLEGNEMKEDQFDQIIELLTNIHTEIRVSHVPDYLKPDQRRMIQAEEFMSACNRQVCLLEADLDDIAQAMSDYTEEAFDDLVKVKEIKQSMNRYEKFSQETRNELMHLQRKGCIGAKDYS